MIFRAIVSMALAANWLMAAEADQTMLRLIGQDVKAIFGVDVDRYRSTSLVKLFPLWIEGESDLLGLSQVIVNEGSERDARLTILRGALTKGDHAGIIRLDATTGIMGDALSVGGAVGRWREHQSPSGDLSAKIRRLSGSYDNWFLVIRPLEKLDEGRPGLSKRRSDLLRLVEEIRGGIRLGGSNEVNVEVTMRTSEDATTLAGIGRWLPGLIPEGRFGPESEIVEMAENFAVRADGTVVFFSFSIPESKLEDLVRRSTLRQNEGDAGTAGRSGIR